MRFLKLFLLLALVGVLYPMAAPNTGSVEGRVSLSGTFPSPTLQKVTMDVDHCNHGPKPTELFVGDRQGGLGNVVVLLQPKTPLGGTFSREKALVMDQKECVYVPHVLVVPAGGTVEFRNSDPVIHNVTLKAVRNRAINQVIGPGSEFRMELKEPEIIPLECDMHYWMKAWIFVADSPYYQVTGPEGSFLLAGLPKGRYTAVVWHEQLGIKKIPIHVQGGRVVRLNVIWTLPRRMGKH